MQRDLAQVCVKQIFDNWTLVLPRFDIAINDIEMWNNNLLPSRKFGKVSQHNPPIVGTFPLEFTLQV